MVWTILFTVFFNPLPTKVHGFVLSVWSETLILVTVIKMVIPCSFFILFFYFKCVHCSGFFFVHLISVLYFLSFELEPLLGVLCVIDLVVMRCTFWVGDKMMKLHSQNIERVVLCS